MPPAPLTFSITTVWPSSSDIRAARIRATRSEPEPTPNGTTKVIGRVGKFWAAATEAPNAS